MDVCCHWSSYIRSRQHTQHHILDPCNISSIIDCISISHLGTKHNGGGRGLKASTRLYQGWLHCIFRSRRRLGKPDRIREGDSGGLPVQRSECFIDFMTRKQ